MIRAFLIVCYFLSLDVAAQVLQEGDDVFQKAAEVDKPVLIVFSGSDWCAPCIRFDQNVLSQEKFRLFAEETIVVYRADFPQRKKLPKQVQHANELLADKYNSRGLFPHLVLLAADETWVHVLQYDHEPIDDFIKKIQVHIDHARTQGASKTK